MRHPDPLMLRHSNASVVVQHSDPLVLRHSKHERQHGSRAGRTTLAALTALALALTACLLPLAAAPAVAAPPRYPCQSPAVFGDLDGNHAVEPADALWLLRDIANLPLPEGGAGCSPHDTNCDGDTDPVDALMILRYVAALEVHQHQSCPALGSSG